MTKKKHRHSSLKEAMHTVAAIQDALKNDEAQRTAPPLHDGSAMRYEGNKKPIDTGTAMREILSGYEPNKTISDEHMGELTTLIFDNNANIPPVYLAQCPEKELYMAILKMTDDKTRPSTFYNDLSMAIKLTGKETPTVANRSDELAAIRFGAVEKIPSEIKGRGDTYRYKSEDGTAPSETYKELLQDNLQGASIKKDRNKLEEIGVLENLIELIEHSHDEPERVRDDMLEMSTDLLNPQWLDVRFPDCDYTHLISTLKGYLDNDLFIFDKNHQTTSWATNAEDAASKLQQQVDKLLGHEVNYNEEKTNAAKIVILQDLIKRVNSYSCNAEMVHNHLTIAIANISNHVKYDPTTHDLAPLAEQLKGYKNEWFYQAAKTLWNKHPDELIEALQEQLEQISAPDINIEKLSDAEILQSIVDKIDRNPEDPKLIYIYMHDIKMALFKMGNDDLTNYLNMTEDNIFDFDENPHNRNEILFSWASAPDDAANLIRQEITKIERGTEIANDPEFW